MRRSYLALLLGLGLSPLPAAASPSGLRPAKRQDDVGGAVVKLLIGGGPSGTIATAEFDGASFDIVANNTIPGTSASWLLPRGAGSSDVYAVDENSDTTRLFRLGGGRGAADDGDSPDGAITLVQNATGSPGVVYLEFGVGTTRIVGSAYGSGRIDVWDATAADGSISLLRQIVPGGELGPNGARQEASHPHQAVLDPTGRFFVVNDLGTDAVLVVDALGDAFDITNRVAVQPAGCGPRHGAFYPAGAGQGPATHYILTCELLSLVQVYEVAYAEDTLQLEAVQSISTYGPDSPPADPDGATTGEIQLSADGRDVYVSNRNTGGEADSISHFAVVVDDGGLSLAFRESVACGGIAPRMFSLGLGAGGFVFSTNQDGELGLVAFKRNADGSLDPTPAASLERSVFGPPGFGPQFVQQI